VTSPWLNRSAGFAPVDRRTKFCWQWLRSQRGTWHRRQSPTHPESIRFHSDRDRTRNRYQHHPSPSPSEFRLANVLYRDGNRSRSVLCWTSHVLPSPPTFSHIVATTSVPVSAKKAFVDPAVSTNETVRDYVARASAALSSEREKISVHIPEIWTDIRTRLDALEEESRGEKTIRYELFAANTFAEFIEKANSLKGIEAYRIDWRTSHIPNQAL
jgi:hypothetical protein